MKDRDDDEFICHPILKQSILRITLPITKIGHINLIPKILIEC